MKRFVCTDSLLVLPISGAFLALLGIVLIILYIVARGLTASLYYVEGALPTYVVAVLLILNGAAVILLLRKRRTNILVYLAIALCCISLGLCILQEVSVGIVSIPFLGSFSACVYHNSLSECQCYILSAKENYTGIIVPGADSEKVTFEAVRSCAVIERSIIDCLYILCITYGFAAIASLVTGSLLCMLLYSQRLATKEEHALHTIESSRLRSSLTDIDRAQGSDRNRETRSQSSAHGPSLENTAADNNAAPGRRATIGHHDVRNERPRIVQRSSSTSTTQGRPPAGRRSSSDVRRGTGRGASNASPQRQVRPPALVRGGYLQLHVNSPSIPVYIVPGSSNEAFISLSDLPSLQLPSLDTVPSYVPEATTHYPTDQPPPYSPTPDENHQSTFAAILESSATPLPRIEQASLHRPAIPEEESIPPSRDEYVEGTAVANEPAETTNIREVPVAETGSVGTELVQAGLVPRSLSQTDQSEIAMSSTNDVTQQPLPHDLNVNQSATPTLMNITDNRQPSENTLDTERTLTDDNRPHSDDTSPRIEETPPVEPLTHQNEVTPHTSPQTISVSVEPIQNHTTASQSSSQGARPKHRQTTEEAYVAHTRSTSPGRKPSRISSRERSSSPRRQNSQDSNVIGEDQSRQTTSEVDSRRQTRARSNSQGRRRQLPDILPTTHLRSSTNTASSKPHEDLSNQAKPHKRSPDQSRVRDGKNHKGSKRAKNPISQAASKSKSRKKPSQSNKNSVQKETSRKDRHHGKSCKSASPRVEMNIPQNHSSSSTESLDNIMTLVKSVHSSAKGKPKKLRQTSNEDNGNLVDSRV